MQELYKGSSTSTLPEREEDFYIDKNATLKKDDLLKYEYLTPIRSYMIERKGVDYQDKSAEEVVEDFVQHMRYFNANSVSTTGDLGLSIKPMNEQSKLLVKLIRYMNS